jgi:hypothetical protein
MMMAMKMMMNGWMKKKTNSNHIFRLHAGIKKSTQKRVVFLLLTERVQEDAGRDCQIKGAGPSPHR